MRRTPSPPRTEIVRYFSFKYESIAASASAHARYVTGPSIREDHVPPLQALVGASILLLMVRMISEGQEYDCR